MKEVINIKKEHEIILEIVKLNNENNERLNTLLDDIDINWIEVLGYLCYHRVAGLAYERMNAINIRKFDFPVFFTTYMIHEAQAMRNEIQKKNILDISKAFDQENIKYVYLKGAILSNTIYPSGTRASNDIDLLIEKKSLDKVSRILNKLGFIQGIYDYKNDIVKPFTQDEIQNSINTRGETSPFIKITNNPTIKTLDVDINFSLDWTPNIDENSIKYFLGKRKKINIGDNNYIYSLKEEHLFIQLCIHLYKDSALLDIVKKRKILDLYKFVDIYLFIQKYFDKMDLQLLYRDTVNFKFEKYVFYAINYTLEIFDDLKNNTNFMNFYKMFNNVNDEIMKQIFDQYDNTIIKNDNGNLKDRLFSYDIIKKFN